MIFSIFKSPFDYLWCILILPDPWSSRTAHCLCRIASDNVLTHQHTRHRASPSKSYLKRLLLVGSITEKFLQGKQGQSVLETMSSWQRHREGCRLPNVRTDSFSCTAILPWYAPKQEPFLSPVIGFISHRHWANACKYLALLLRRAVFLFWRRTKAKVKLNRKDLLCALTSTHQFSSNRRSDSFALVTWTYPPCIGI